MTIQPIGLNFTSINDVNLTIDIAANATDLIPAIVSNANTSTNFMFTFVMMAAWWIIIFWTLGDKSPLGTFKYSDPRALNTSIGCVSVLGITFLEAGFFSSIKTVGLFVVLFSATYIFTIIYEHKE